MSSIKMWYLSASSLSDEMNKAKNILLDYLFKEKLISNKTYDDMSLNTFFVIQRPSKIHRLWVSIFGSDEEEEFQIVFSRQLTMNSKVKKRNFKIVKAKENKKEDKVKIVKEHKNGTRKV